MTMPAEPRIDNRDWGSLSLGEQIQQIEVEGHFMLPDLLISDHRSRLKAETRTFKTVAKDYSEDVREAL